MMRRTRLLALLLLTGCARPPGPAPAPAVSPAPAPAFKPVSFAILEDYDKGDDLEQVARDFHLMKRLGVTTWRGSFGWDDYEPEPGVYDFAWLHRFAQLAADSGITLRPYLAYTPAWAGVGGDDGEAWNDPPADLAAWAAFVDTLARALARHPNIASYEIYNEENVQLWWEGTVGQYNQVLEAASNAVRAVEPARALIIGGLVWPDAEWMEATCDVQQNPTAFDIAAFHAYPETWTPDSVVVENYLDAGYYEGYLPVVREVCADQPIWINELGFATTPGVSELEQASWWARAFATFLAAPGIEHLGIYEIKDLPTDEPVIGDAPNYHLGLTYTDRREKLAFRTVDLLTDLLGTDSLAVLDPWLRVRVSAGTAGALHQHAFLRPDGRQVVFVWDKRASPTVTITLPRPGSAATAYALDGSARPYPAFDGRTLERVSLEPGSVRIFVIEPAEPAWPGSS